MKVDCIVLRHLPPEGKKREHLVVGLIALDVSGGVEHELALGVLGKECKRPLHPLAPGAGPMLFEH